MVKLVGPNEKKRCSKLDFPGLAPQKIMRIFSKKKCLAILRKRALFGMVSFRDPFKGKVK